MNQSNQRSSGVAATPVRVENIATTASMDEAQIRQIMQEHGVAVRAKDINKSMAHYAARILFFDTANSMQNVGLEACRKRTEEWFASFQGPIGYDSRDLSITTADEVAFCHSLIHVAGMSADGAKIALSWRATICFRKTGDQWLIEHEHASVPFDVNSGSGRAGREA
jgi:ketosteroid isomerase-like protein